MITIKKNKKNSRSEIKKKKEQGTKKQYWGFCKRKNK